MNVSHSSIYHPAKQPPKPPEKQSVFSSSGKTSFSATVPLNQPKEVRFSAASATGSEADLSGLNNAMKEILSKLEELLKPFKPFIEKLKNNPLLLLVGGLLAAFGFNGLQGKPKETAEAET